MAAKERLNAKYLQVLWQTLMPPSAGSLQIFDCACERLRRLTGKMIKGYPNVHRWEQTDDVLQNAVIRLQRTLQQLPVATAQDFFRLAALQIREAIRAG